MSGDFAEAIRLREAGRVEEARDLLLDLVSQSPEDPMVNYQCAWAHDKLGLEHEAAPFYEKAIANGLQGEDLRGALLGLGSTYRAMGEYARALATLDRGIATFPDAGEFPVFRAMTLYNLGESREAVAALLRAMVESCGGEDVSRYRRAIEFYADHLDETW
jgi:tetratricopeptide (TPR) repeat protein